MRREESKGEEGNERKLLIERERNKEEWGDERRRRKRGRQGYMTKRHIRFIPESAVSSEFGFFPKKTEIACLL